VLVISSLTKICRVFSTNNDQCFLFEPPFPVKKFYYRCDRKFHLDDLIKLYETYDNHAIVLVSGKRTEFHLYNENQTKLLKSIEESLPNQHKTGGQSALRFERIRSEKIGWYVKKIVELMVNLYVKENKFQCKSLVIAGPAQIKDMLTGHDIFIQYFEKYLSKTLTISEITSQSIQQVVYLAQDTLSSNNDEVKRIQYFEEMLSNPVMIDLIVFGNDEVLKEFNSGRLKELYLFHKSMLYDKINFECKTKIYSIKSTEFVSKYGELVGIRYYAINDVTSLDEVELE